MDVYFVITMHVGELTKMVGNASPMQLAALIDVYQEAGLVSDDVGYKFESIRVECNKGEPVIAHLQFEEV